MYKKIIFMSICHNCKHSGHHYKSCKIPIVSYGTVQFRFTPNGKIQYLLICRKNTLGYIDFLRGKYRCDDEYYILCMIKQMTNEEKKNILTYNFNSLWANLWHSTSFTEFDILSDTKEKKYKKNEYYYSYDKFAILKENKVLHNLINQCNKYTQWELPEWGFPKGRRNYNESNYSCAMRETEEETGYNVSDMYPVTTLSPFTETFRGSNYKIYKHVYYIVNILYEDDIEFKKKKFDNGEISQMKWLSYEECLLYIRNYNIEKKQIITDINNILYHSYSPNYY